MNAHSFSRVPRRSWSTRASPHQRPLAHHPRLDLPTSRSVAPSNRPLQNRLHGHGRQCLGRRSHHKPLRVRCPRRQLFRRACRPRRPSRLGFQRRVHLPSARLGLRRLRARHRHRPKARFLGPRLRLASRHRPELPRGRRLQNPTSSTGATPNQPCRSRRFASPFQLPHRAKASSWFAACRQDSRSPPVRWRR